MSTKWTYPQAKRLDTTEKGLPDPYTWLENPDSEETKKWVEAQNVVTESHLSTIEYRKKIKSKLEDRCNYPRYGCPFKRGSLYFFYKNDGLQNQSVLYVQDSLEAEPRVFFDPNKLAEDGTASLGVTAFSEAGKYFAHGVSRSGSDWQVIHVKDVNTGEDLPDKLEWIKFSSIAWTHDEEGFFYSRYPQPSTASASLDSTNPTAGSEVDVNEHHKIYYHKLNTSQSSDKLIYETPEHPKWMFGVEITDDGKYLTVLIYESTAPVNKFYYLDLAGLDINSIKDWKDLKIIKIIDNFDAGYDLIASNEKIFYLKTNHKAPKYKIISIDVTPTEDGIYPSKDVVAEDPVDALSYAAVFNKDKLALCYIHDVKDVLFVHRLESGERLSEVELPSVGTISEIRGRRKDDELFYSFVSFLYPGTIFRFTQDLKSHVFREIKVEGFDPTLYEAKQIFYNSKDGTKIPMFIISKKGIELKGNNPVYLYGYGGFNISVQPRFSVFRLVFMNHLDIVIAIANIRGGGEYGDDWHKSGILDKKQNGFDDFIAAGEWLVENKYTQPSKLAISGGSNGGLLVAACANQRPDLFGAVVPEVGVLDMLKFHKFTIGHAWTADYGCADVPEQFEWLKKYSPVHNVTAKPYPAMLLTTADHDDRVVPLHSFKYIAELQHTVGSYEKQVNPLLIRIETKAGHGGGKPISKAIEEAADVYSFIGTALGCEWKD